MNDSLISLQQDETDLIKKITKLNEQKEKDEKELKSKKHLFNAMLVSCICGVSFALITAVLKIDNRPLVEYFFSNPGEPIPLYKLVIFYGSLAAFTEGIIPGIAEYNRRQSLRNKIFDYKEDIRCAESQLENIKKAIYEYSLSATEELEDDYDFKVSETDDYDKVISETDDFDLKAENNPKALKRIK